MLTKVVEDYKKIQSNVDFLIKERGYQVSFVCVSLGIDEDTFHLKCQNVDFSVREIEYLLDLIQADDLEDKVLAEMSLEAEKEEETVRLNL